MNVEHVRNILCIGDIDIDSDSDDFRPNDWT